jgi:hypothetical protein
MNAIVRAGLIAGAIGGEAMILLVLVNTILLRTFSAGRYAETNPGIVSSWGIIYPLLVILVFEGGGIFSSWLCRASLKARRDAVITGTIAGITIGIILEIMWLANILSLASRSVRFGSDVLMGYGSSIVVVLLLITLVAMGSVLAAFGSYIYSVNLFSSEGTNNPT